MCLRQGLPVVTSAARDAGEAAPGQISEASPVNGGPLASASGPDNPEGAVRTGTEVASQGLGAACGNLVKPPFLLGVLLAFQG